MLYELKAIASSIKIHIKLSIARGMFRFVIFFQPILYSFLMYMIFKNSSNNNSITYVMLGSGILTLWSSIIFSSAGDIERERRMGTLQIINCVPISFYIIMIGKVLGNMIWGLFSILISVITIVFLLNEKIYIAHSLFFLFSLFLTILAFISISLVLAGIFTISRNAYGLMNALEFPIYILCGFLVPLEYIPKFIHPLSYILSPTWAMKVLRTSIVGIDNYNLFITDIFILSCIIIIYFFLSLLFFKIIDKKIRINASLGGL